MGSELLRIFDPRRNFQLQGFTGRAATTTLHDATATGVSISGIFQGAEDFGVLELYHAYDYYNHLRLKHLPRTDLSGITLAFDIEYDHDLDGAMRLDAAKYPSVAWDAITFVCNDGRGTYDTHEVSLLKHATVIDGEQTPASMWAEVSGAEILDGGIDWLHLYFRDTRYTVTSTDCRLETQILGNVAPDPAGGLTEIYVYDTTGFAEGDTIDIERGGTNFETTSIVQIVSGVFGKFYAYLTKTHADKSYISRQTEAWHLAKKLADIINTHNAGDVAGRFGPDQSSVIKAEVGGGTTYQSGSVHLEFQPAASDGTIYGKLGNLDRVVVTHGRTNGGAEDDTQQGFQWTDGSGSSYRFGGGDNTIRYHIELPFNTLTDKNGAAVDATKCWKIYMVFAPRFERAEEELEDGCFLTALVNPGDTTWSVDDGSKLTGGRYFIGTPTSKERILLVAGGSTSISVQRGYEGSTAGSWPTGTRLQKLPPDSGFTSDVEWRATISNITVTGDASLKVGGGSSRIKSSDARCKYTGTKWQDYAYGAGWPSQWWSGGHARRIAPNNDHADIGDVSITYSYPKQHDLYLGTFDLASSDFAFASVYVDGAFAGAVYPVLNEYGGRSVNLRIATGVAAGSHTVRIEPWGTTPTAFFYFDYLWPLEPQDVPDAPQVYGDVSLAIDFDTVYGNKKPPAWLLWQLQKLGFQGHADVYMGVFWNNKRQRIGASYPYATVAFTGTPTPGETVAISIAGTTITHAMGYGETLQSIASQLRMAINAIFSSAWANDNFGSSTTLRIQAKAPSQTFTGVAVTSSANVTLTLVNNLGTAGAEGDWELLDSVSPVMTEGARKWLRDLAGQFAAAGIPASFAFSMECYNPPAGMRAKYLRKAGGVVQQGDDVFLPTPSYQMHFGTRVRNYLKQMYKECADEVAAAGLAVALQFGETQWWYFDNRATDANGGMGFYDQETIDAFAAAKGHQIWPFVANTDDPAGDPAHPYETANFLRDRIWSYCQEVMAYVLAYHPTAVFECLWPLDANQGKPSPDPAYRALLMRINLPDQWKSSSFGLKYFRCEGFDYDVWQKNAVLMKQTLTYANATLGRPASECMYLAGLYGPPDPPLAQAYSNFRASKVYSMALWAFDQFCLNSRPVPLPTALPQAQGTAAVYHKPKYARAAELPTAVVVIAPPSGALNRFKGNEGKLNG